MPLNVTTPEMTSEVTCNDSWAECARWRMWLWPRCRPWFRWAGLVGRANLFMLLCGYFPLWHLLTEEVWGWEITYREYGYLCVALLIGCDVAVHSLIQLKRGWRSREVNLEALVGLLFAGGSTGLALLAYAWHWGVF